MDVSSEDNDDNIMRKALAVELPEDFDPNRVPQTGEEYVQYVMYEARQLKKCVAAKIDAEKLKNQTYYYETIEDCPKPPPSFLPTEAWQKEKTEDFKKLQLFLKSKLPSDPTNDTVHVSHWEGKILTQTPKFDDLCDLTQLAKTKILKVILDCLEKIPEGESFCYETGVWLYGLLATLEMPLHPDTHHLIRSIARKCACIRACLGHDSPEEVYVPLNLIICVVGRGFGQYDLAD